MLSSEANIFLPPVSPALETYTSYAWCQVASVFAREMARANGKTGDPIAWTQYWSQANELADTIHAALGDEAALGAWARPGEANWSEVACFGYAYGKAPPSLRVQILKAIREGVMGDRLVAPPLIEGSVCPREVVYEPLYQPEPACYPDEARVPVAVTVASVLVGGFATWVLIKVAEQIRGRD